MSSTTAALTVSVLEESDESDADSEGTEIAGSSDTGAAKGKGKTTPAVAVDEVGAQDAFVAGMIYALSRRLLPGAPYSPGLAGVERTEDDRRWRLDECLRFATELAGRKAKKRGWEGLADELARGGWFDA
ncbi:hypothetical protein EVG20_g5769 [Dentipellis fragilis]|uniref:Carbohydrate kinase PfkB domain-containing protein n=1 Tax=Dentipellis fragilis TaxID=205917 RepID=A0A4Y9YT58_9AGAM|nr:hypothetical protein EVG20_g5769 [Dentipellis fragilis]